MDPTVMALCYVHMDTELGEVWSWEEEAEEEEEEDEELLELTKRRHRHTHQRSKRRRRLQKEAEAEAEAEGDAQLLIREQAAEAEAEALKLFGLQGEFPKEDEDRGLGAPAGALYVQGLDDHASISRRQLCSLGTGFTTIMRIFLAKEGLRLNYLLHNAQGTLAPLAQHNGVVVDTTAPMGHLLTFSDRVRLQAAALGKFSPGSDDMFKFVMVVRDLKNVRMVKKQIKRNRRLTKRAEELKRQQVSQWTTMLGTGVG